MKNSDGLGAAKTAQILGIALVLVTILAVMVFIVMSDAHCHQTHDCGGYQGANERGHQQRPNFPWWYPRDALGLYTLLLAIFTGGLVLVSIWQGYFLIRAESNARRAADAALLAANAAITQANHLESSVAEAKRAATAMEDVAKGMARSARAGSEMAASAAESASAAWAGSSAADRTALIMKQTAERQLRAYVFVTDAIFEQVPKPEGLTIWHETFTGNVVVEIKNFGSTPGYMARIKMDVFIDHAKDTSIQIPFTEKAQDFPTVSVPPGQTITLRIQAMGAEFYMRDWYDYRNREQFAYLVGHVDYVDAFGGDQATAFQMICRFHPRITSFDYTAGGNGAT